MSSEEFGTLTRRCRRCSPSSCVKCVVCHSSVTSFEREAHAQNNITSTKPQQRSVSSLRNAYHTSMLHTSPYPVDLKFNNKYFLVQTPQGTIMLFRSPRPLPSRSIGLIPSRRSAGMPRMPTHRALASEAGDLVKDTLILFQLGGIGFTTLNLVRRIRKLATSTTGVTDSMDLDVSYRC